MVGYVFNRCKKVLWLVVIIMLLSTISAIMGNYIYKFIGFVIDYGLNYSEGSFSSEFTFLFDGTFGNYGSLKLIITLSGCMLVSALISYASILLSWYLQKRGYYYLANEYRKEIFHKSKGKKLPYSTGDMFVVLSEDIYSVAANFVTYYPNVISSVVSIVYTIFMLNTISPYLLITPLILTPIIIYYSINYHKDVYKEQQAYRVIDGGLKESINESISSNDDEKLKKFKEINESHTRQRETVSLVSNKYSTKLNVTKIMIYMLSIGVAGILAIKGKILIGEYLIFSTFINTIYTQIISLISNLISVRSAQPRVEKVKNLMEVTLNEK